MSKADFVVYSLLESCLKMNSKVVFVAAQQNFAHYSAVMKKMVGWYCEIICLGYQSSTSN